MRGALGGPRVLLRRLREVMAEPVSAQDRLDKVVVLIAANMVAEVCSVYVLRVDGTLELYATEGLKREAVHETVLKADEGLVGLVASEANPINLSDAQAHPAFSFRPETGEEIYHSFLGVPVLRAGNTLGVLVVQNRARRTYTEEEEEALQTTAMVLAEMIASGELSSIARPGAEPVARHALHISGTALSDGIALGHVVLHEPRVVITNVIADDVPRELKRLDAAIATFRADLDRTARARRRGRRRRASRGARSLPHVRLRPGLAAQDARGGDDRPHRRGRRRARAVRYPRAHAARVRSLSARPPARPRRSRQPADARADGAGSRALAGATAGERHPGRALDGPGGAARLRPQKTARPGAGGRRADLACLDRGARARHSDGRRDRQRHRPGRAGRRHHRRRHQRRRAYAPAGRYRNRLCRAGEAAGAAPGAISRAARQALRHQGRPQVRADDQCGPHHRLAASRRDRRRRHRPVPHRIAVHGRRYAAAHQRAARALPHRARCRRKTAGDLPHPRYRRRQGAALYAQYRGGKSGARLARHPARARPARPAAQPGARAAARRRRARIAPDVPDDRHGGGVRQGQVAGRDGADASAPARPRAARAGAYRHHAGSARAAVPARGIA